MSGANESELYEFHVLGELSEGVLMSFADLHATRRDGATILTGNVRDQAALFGVLDRIEALGIPLIEVRRARPASPCR